MKPSCPKACSFFDARGSSVPEGVGKSVGGMVKADVILKACISYGILPVECRKVTMGKCGSCCREKYLVNHLSEIIYLGSVRNCDP